MFVADGIGARDGAAAIRGAASAGTGASAPEACGRQPSTSLTAGLAAELDRLLDDDPHGLSDGELAGAMVELRREQARLAAVVAQATAAFDARQLHAEDGARSASDWVAVRARLPRAQASREVREARRLRAMPAAQAGFRDGAINPAHVQVLCRLAGHPRAGQHFAESEAHLVAHAARLRFDDWLHLAHHWLAAADPDGPEHKRERDQDLRRFGVPVGLDGVGHPGGYLTPLASETVNEALARIERELFQADWTAAREIHGDATTVAHLARTPAQRRHDALVEMAVRSATAPGDGQRPAPLVTVMVDYPTLAGRVCQLAGSGTVVAPGDIAELLGRDDSLIERVVFDGPNRVRDISRARTFRGVLRRILEVVHPRCDDATCFVPAKDCEGDHVVPWSQGGATSQDNGRMGCGFHNRLWYRHPHLRPPARQLTFVTPASEPPSTGPPTADRADKPARDPAQHPRGADPPTIASFATTDSVVRRAGRPSRGCRGRQPAPDLIVTAGDANHEITFGA